MWYEKDDSCDPGGGTDSVVEVPDPAQTSCGTDPEGCRHRLCLDRRSLCTDPDKGAGEGDRPGRAAGRPGSWLPGSDGKQPARHRGPGRDCPGGTQPARGAAAGVRSDAVSLFARVDLAETGRCAVCPARRLDAADPARVAARHSAIRRRFSPDVAAAGCRRRTGGRAAVHCPASGAWAGSSQRLVSRHHRCGATPCSGNDDQDSLPGYSLPASRARPVATDPEVPLAAAARWNHGGIGQFSAESHAARWDTHN